MKIIKLCFLPIVLCLWSCSNDSSSDVGITSTAPVTNYLLKEGDLNEGANVLNPYDDAGIVYTDLMDLYFSGGAKDAAVADIIQRFRLLSSAHYGFMSLSESPYVFGNNANAIDLIGLDPEQVLSEAITAHFKNRIIGVELKGFLLAHSALCEVETDYSVLYDSIVSFEHRIMNDVSLNEADLKILLTTTSIVRYATHHRKKRPKKNTDPEWDLLIFDMAGACSGSRTSTQEAVALSVISGIVASH